MAHFPWLVCQIRGGYYCNGLFAHVGFSRINFDDPKADVSY